MNRRDLLRTIGLGTACAYLTPLPPLDNVNADAKALVVAAAQLDADLLGPWLYANEGRRWQSRYERLTGRARDLICCHPSHAVAWYAAARCYWVDVDAEIDAECRAMLCVEKALDLKPDHLPSLMLGWEIASLLAMVHDDTDLLDRSVEMADDVERLTYPHPGGAAFAKNARLEREFLLAKAPATKMSLTPLARDAWQTLEREIECMA